MKTSKTLWTVAILSVTLTATAHAGKPGYGPSRSGNNVSRSLNSANITKSLQSNQGMKFTKSTGQISSAISGGMNSSGRNFGAIGLGNLGNSKGTAGGIKFTPGRIIDTTGGTSSSGNGHINFPPGRIFGSVGGSKDPQNPIDPGKGNGHGKDHGCKQPGKQHCHDFCWKPYCHWPSYFWPVYVGSYCQPVYVTEVVEVVRAVPVVQADLELVRVRLVESGDAGALYRVTIRNAGTLDVAKAFSVGLIASETAEPKADNPKTVGRLAGIKAGQTMEFDVRLPATNLANLLAIVDTQNEVTEATKDNNAGQFARDQIAKVQ